MQRIRIGLILALIACLIIALSTHAMSSPNYAVDWMVPLSGGGGAASSTDYAINMTVGQTAIGKASSPSYAAQMGYWYGIAREQLVFLPMVQK